MIGSDLFEQLMAETKRVRDEVMPAYLALGVPGDNAVRNMRRQLDGVMRAIFRQDAERATVLVAALKLQRMPSDGAIRAGRP